MKNKIKRNILKQFFVYLSIYLGLVIIFSISMIGTYFLPNERIRNHIKESEELLLSTNTNLLFSEDVKGANLDQFTDQLIMNTAMNKGKKENESIVIRAFENSRYSNESGDSSESLKQVLEDPNLFSNQEYSRYWHGIQTIIRPLLLFFNYEEIRYLFVLLIFILLVTNIIMLYRNLNFLYAIGFLFSMLSICIFIVPMSIQYTGVFVVMFLSLIAINIIHNKEKEILYPYLFFIIGGCTTFFDLLTAPLLTLGIPLIIVILLKNEKEKNLRYTIIYVVKLSLLWVISYASIFFIKWVIASVVLGQDMITIAVNQLLWRTNGSADFPTTKLGAINENLKYLLNAPLIAFIGLIFTVWLITIICYGKNLKNLKNVIPLLMISIYPYIWYMIFNNHSTIHAYFTYRVQAITMLGVFYAMIECIDLKRIKKERNSKNEGNSSVNTVL